MPYSAYRLFPPAGAAPHGQPACHLDRALPGCLRARDEARLRRRSPRHDRRDHALQRKDQSASRPRRRKPVLARPRRDRPGWSTRRRLAVFGLADAGVARSHRHRRVDRVPVRARVRQRSRGADRRPECDRRPGRVQGPAPRALHHRAPRLGGLGGRRAVRSVVRHGVAGRAVRARRRTLRRRRSGAVRRGPVRAGMLAVDGINGVWIAASYAAPTGPPSSRRA